MNQAELMEIEKRFNRVIPESRTQWEQQVVREDFKLLVFLVRKLIVEKTEIINAHT